MANENKESTQVSWDMVGSRVIATMPISGEKVEFDVKDLHESWILFGKGYFIQQHAASYMAKYSFKADKNLKKRLAIAIDEENAGDEKTVRDEIRAAKIAWLKAEGATLRTALFNQMKQYSQPMQERAKAERETKAQMELRLKLELKEKAIAAGMDAAMADVVFGV